MRQYETIRTSNKISSHPDLPIEKLLRSWGVTEFAEFAREHIVFALPEGWTAEMMGPGRAGIRDTQLSIRAEITYDVGDEKNEKSEDPSLCDPNPDEMSCDIQLHLRQRFEIHVKTDQKRKPSEVEVVDNKTKRKIADFDFGFMNNTDVCLSASLASANQWLSSIFPDWENPLVYWDMLL